MTDKTPIPNATINPKDIKETHFAEIFCPFNSFVMTGIDPIIMPAKAANIGIGARLNVLCTKAKTSTDDNTNPIPIGKRMRNDFMNCFLMLEMLVTNLS